MARYMKASVPGMDVPDELIDRLKGVPKEKVAEEGIKIAIEMIQHVRQIKGVAGVHIMAPGNDGSQGLRGWVESDLYATRLNSSS